MTPRRRTIVIVAVLAGLAAIVVLFVLARFFLFKAQGTVVVVTLGFSAVVVLGVGITLLLVLTGDSTHLRRLLWARDRRCPGCGLRPVTPPVDGLCATCGAAMEYPPLVYPVRGPCSTCGYPITEVRGERCPECGTPLHPLHIASQNRA
jgi:hypothetical protein